MKIVSFTGGLGNQLFEYLFCQRLSRRYPPVYGYYRSARMGKNGLEIQRWFDVQLPPTTWYSQMLAVFYKVMMKLRLLEESNERSYTDGKKGFYFESFWQDRRFYEEADIQRLAFRAVSLSVRNQEILSRVQSVESVAIHVRRGDYMSSEFYEHLGSICTMEYYRMALERLQPSLSSPHYFVFSDDISWCREHFSFLEHVDFVDWNTGEDSFYDMYLMSHCRHHIISNSTFSYWAARLSRSEGITIYPERWARGWDAPDIFPDNWIGIFL